LTAYRLSEDMVFHNNALAKFRICRVNHKLAHTYLKNVPHAVKVTLVSIYINIIEAKFFFFTMYRICEINIIVVSSNSESQERKYV